MKLTMDLSIAGDRLRLTTKPIDVVKWELSRKRKVSDGLGAADTLQICHLAAQRLALTSAPFEAWLESLDDFEVADEAPPGHPPQDH